MVQNCCSSKLDGGTACLEALLECITEHPAAPHALFRSRYLFCEKIDFRVKKYWKNKSAK